MKKTLKQLPLWLALLVLVACNDYGRKINIAGTKGEVYYKGKGVTETDAKNVGDYLKKIDFFSDAKPATVQITNSDDAYTVRFVYDKSYFDKTPTVEGALKGIAVDMSKEIFSGKKVNIALSDSTMKDFKTIPYDPSAQTASTGNTSTPDNDNNSGSSLGPNTSTLGTSDDGSSLGPANSANSLANYQHETLGGILFYWKDVTTSDMKIISDYIIKSGDFSGGNGNVNIIVNKENNDHYVIRFPIQEVYANDAATQTAMEKVAQKIKDNVFAKQSYSFIITDTHLNNIKSWDY